MPSRLAAATAALLALLAAAASAAAAPTSARRALLQPPQQVEASAALAGRLCAGHLPLPRGQAPTCALPACTLQMPAAAAYFPLTGRDLSSAFPPGQYEGVADNLRWEEDPAFGEVLACDEVRLPRSTAQAHACRMRRRLARLRCRWSAAPLNCSPPHRPAAPPASPPALLHVQRQQSHVVIPGLQYGAQGPFALAVWARPRVDAGSSFDYIFSHSNAAGTTDFAYDPNEARPSLPLQLL